MTINFKINYIRHTHVMKLIYFCSFLFSGHERGRAGGGWGDGNEAGSSSPSQPLRSGYHHVHSPIANKSQNNGAVNVVGGMARDQEASYTEQERLLVEEITAPGGVRAAPPRESLNTFINRSDNLQLYGIRYPNFIECL